MPAVHQMTVTSTTSNSRNATSSQNTNYVDDNANYNQQLPTPSSASFPSLTQSGSGSSVSPPQPATPPRGRSSSNRRRHPSVGRVPLHRRGTSKTYERLEDLLREAGYKETRIFTPETERVGTDKTSGVKSRGSMRGGVDAVVGFLTGLMPNRNHDQNLERDESSLSATRPCSDPESPLANRQRQMSPPSTPSTFSSSVESLDRQGLRTYIPDRNSNSSHHIHQPVIWPPLKSITDPPSQSSRAGAYLRHIASAPTIPKRLHSSLAGNVQPNNSRRLLYLNDDEPENRRPPLPLSWLETVTRAVLSGGPGAHIGGPAGMTPAPPVKGSSHSIPRPRPLRQTKSSLSQATHKSNDRRSRRPPIISRVGVTKTAASTSEISLTRVVCRSAPVSRASSRVRNGEHEMGTQARPSGASEYLMIWEASLFDEDRRQHGSGKGKQRERTRRRARKRMKDTDFVPCLGKTKVEGDVWSKDRRFRQTFSEGNAGSSQGSRHLNGLGIEAEDQAEEDQSSSSEDEGELDLARILVPAKRQNSIRSLRRHLAGQAPTNGPAFIPGRHQAPSGRTSRTGSVSRWGRDTDVEDDDTSIRREEWGGGWVRQSNRRQESREEDGEDELQTHIFTRFLRHDERGSRASRGSVSNPGTGNSRIGVKRRIGLPGVWGT